MIRDDSFAICIIKTYAAYQHRKHIMKIWEYLGHNHPAAYKGYGEKLFGKHLTGRDGIFHTLYFADRDIYNRFHLKIPERVALGVAVGVAYSFLK